MKLPLYCRIRGSCSVSPSFEKGYARFCGVKTTQLGNEIHIKSRWGIKEMVVKANIFISIL
jgi:hypothetical protein